MKTIKKSIALLLALVMVLAIAPISAFAEDDALNYLEYEIKDFSNDVWITGYKNDPVNLVIPAEIEGFPVTVIGWRAFGDCISLQSITIPNSVKSTVGHTFSGCSSLESVILSNSITDIGNDTFAGCSSLQSITIPDSVKGIGGSAFFGCSSLQSIILPDDVTYIGSEAFSGCSSLQSITISNAIIDIGSYAFSGCSSLQNITIPNSVTSIGTSAFENCSSLESIILPDDITEIDSDTFFGCSSLQSITIPDSVESIGWRAFSGCSSLQSITIPDSVTSIGGSAFSGCSSLKEVHISSIEAWLNLSFSYNDNPLSNGAKLYLNNALVENLVIPDGIGEIKDYAFEGCSSIKSITIPNSVTSIGLGAFSGCSSLESITIPDSVTSINYQAFMNCSSLESIIIPDSITGIGSYAFGSCTSLKNIVIPDSVTGMDWKVFSGCSSLESATIGSGVTSMYYDIFDGCSSLSNISVADENPVYDSRNNCNAIIETATDTLVVGCANTVIPNSVVTIMGAFNGLGAIESIAIPGTVKTVIDSFNDCNNSALVTIPNGIQNVVSSFCSNELKEISFPDSIRFVMIDFSDCTNLEKISIGDIAFDNFIVGLECTKYYQNEANWENDILYIDNHVVAIREKATGEYIIREGTKTFSNFGDYSKIKSVTVPDSVVAMPSLQDAPIYNNPENWENGELYIGNHLIAVDSSITGIYTIRENTKSMAAMAFTGNTAIEKVIIPDSISFIPNGCFMNCSSLKSVTIPNTVSHIGYSVFMGAESLETIEIPESVEYIGVAAFLEFTSLTDAYIYNGDCSIMELESITAFDKSTTIHSYAGGKVEESANKYGYNFVALPPKPHTHTFGEWTVVTPATYTAAGEKTRACTGCEETEIEVIPMLVAENVATNDNTGITVKYDDSVYGEDIQLDISEVTEGAAFELVNGDNGNGHHKSKLFDINTTVNGVKVQPNGKVLVGIPVPRGFNEKKVVIYYVTDDGSRLEKLDSYVENGIIWFETDHFSYYAVVDESEIVEEKSAWELFLDILRNFFRLILKLFSFSL